MKGRREARGHGSRGAVGGLTAYTIPLGAEPVDALRERLRAAGVQTNPYFEQLWPRVRVASTPRPATVVVGTAAAFGLDGGVTLDELVAHGAPRGWAPCPLEAAALLRLVVDEPPDLGRITVVSARVGDDEAAPRGLYLRRDADGVWLRGLVASDDWRFEVGERFAVMGGG